MRLPRWLGLPRVGSRSRCSALLLEDSPNLLPYRALRLAAWRRQRWLEVLLAGSVGVVVALLSAWLARSHQARAESVTARWVAQLHALQPAQDEYARLSAALRATRQRARALSDLAVTRDQLLYLLEALGAGAGHGIQLDQVHAVDGIATVTGNAVDQRALSAWAHSLTRAIGVESIEMSDIRSQVPSQAPSQVPSALASALPPLPMSPANLHFSARILLIGAGPASRPDARPHALHARRLLRPVLGSTHPAQGASLATPYER